MAWFDRHTEKQLAALARQAAVFKANRDERKREAELARIKAEEKTILHEEAVEDADEMRRHLFWGDE